MKTCRECNREKPIKAFRTGKHQCKECRKKLDKPRRVAHYRENAEELKEAARQWREANPEYGKEYAKVRHVEHAERDRAAWKNYYPAKRERILARAKQRYRENIESELERAAKYRADNPDRHKRYYALNREKVRKQTSEYRKATPERQRRKVTRYRIQKRGADGTHTVAEWRALVDSFGGHCVCCGEHFGIRNLTEDHVVPLTLGGSDFIANIQPLCHPCNSRKGNRHATDYRSLWTTD